MRYNKIITFADLLLESFKSLVDIIFNTDFLNRFKIKINNEQIIVIGNGSSLKEHIGNNSIDLKKSSKMVLNFFPLSEWFFSLKPNYYILVDNAAVNYHSHHLITIIDKMNNLFLTLKKVDWPMNIFISNFHKNSDFEKSIISLQNKNLNILYFNSSYAGGFWFYKRFLLLKGWGLPSTRNVSIVAIAISILLRYKKIILIGFNHDWMNSLTVNEDNKIHINEIHFSNKNEGNIINWKTSMAKLTFGWHKIFSSHEDLNKLSNSLNINIVNKTKSSLIDAYKK